MNIELNTIQSFIEVDSLSFMIEYKTGEIVNYYFVDVTIDNVNYNNFSELPNV